MIKLYSNDCPKCKILKRKLDEANIEYEEISDETIMLDKGFLYVPVLELEGKTMNYAEAFKWIEEGVKV